MYVTSLSSKDTLDKLKGDFKQIDCHFERFPDGEGYVRFDEKVTEYKRNTNVHLFTIPKMNI
jgi:phosphoribosylpyrophosphate synthetase